MTLEKPIGGNFSLTDSNAFISAKSNDSFRDFFPEKLNERHLLDFETGTDSLAFIILDIFKKNGNIPVFFPNHYCGDTIERLKLKVQDLKIHFYSEITELHFSTPLIIIWNHFNKYLTVPERIIQQKNSIWVEDFVHAPFDINKTKGQYAFNSLRKFCNMELSLAYGNFSITKETDETSNYYSQKKIAEAEKANWQSSPNNILEESFLEHFKLAEKELHNENIQSANTIETEKLNYYQFEKILDIRRSNYAYLKKELASIETIQIIEGEYMFLMIQIQNRDALRKELFDNAIFPPIHWLDSRNDELSKTLLSLPIDQRYNENNLKRIVTVIKSFYGN
jgi:hypothetical protein